MTAPRRWLAVFLAALPSLAVRAQDGASTLAANLAAADAVVVAAVTAVHEPRPGTLAASFRVDDVVAGAAPAAFALAEPAGACCGRSLFALQPGDVRLLFVRRSGPAWHLVGGPRGALPALPAVVAHVRALVTAATPAARRDALLAALQSEEPRLVDDAALALAADVDLALDPAGIAAVGHALQRALDRREGRAVPLLDVALRAGDAALREATLARYLAAGDDDEAALLRQGLLRAPAVRAAELAVARASDERAGQRAAELVAALPADRAVPAGLQLLQQATHPRVQVRLCQDLLRRGVPADQLRAAPAQVVDAARRLMAKTPAYRVLAPGVR